MKFWDNVYRPFVLSKTLARVFMSRFVQKIFVVENRREETGRLCRRQCQSSDLPNQKRDTFWSDTIAANQSSARLLWRSVDLLLGRGRVPASDAINVDQFRRFFTDKVDAVRPATAGGLPPTFSTAPYVLVFRLQASNGSLLMILFRSSAGCQTRVALPTHFRQLS